MIIKVNFEDLIFKSTRESYSKSYNELDFYDYMSSSKKDADKIFLKNTKYRTIIIYELYKNNKKYKFISPTFNIPEINLKLKVAINGYVEIVIRNDNYSDYYYKLNFL